MTEKEKMLQGFLFFPLDELLTKERNISKKIIYEFNKTNFIEKNIRKTLLTTLLGSTKEIFTIETPFNCDYGYNISIGNNFYSNTNLTILNAAKVSIGDNVFIGPNVSIFTISHPADKNIRAKAYQYASFIIIKNDVWIGGNFVILPNVTIGENTIIGARSIVPKTIPANVIATGNPCKVLKNIDDKILEESNEFKI